MNQLFTDLLVIDKGSEVDVYVSCTEVCDWMKAEADKLVNEGLAIMERANNKFVNDEDRSTYIATGSRFECVADMGKMFADSALSVIGNAIISRIDTVEDMGFTDE